MSALDRSLTVATCALTSNNRDQILLLAMWANQIEQVVLCGNCPHVRVPVPRFSSVAFRLVYRKE
jgi:hypothetical protein